jgi:hypothetical protein
MPPSCRRGLVQHLPFDDNPPLGAIDARQCSEQAGLAASIGADDRNQLPGLNYKVRRLQASFQRDMLGHQ